MAARVFLGVERSFSGKTWRERLDAAQSVQALAIAQQHGLGDLLARVLAARGVAATDTEAFLDPSVKRHMPDPSSLIDMDAAADRLAVAAIGGERVAVFGDYDVDGATSAALLADWLGQAGAHPRIHIPDRISEGYGPNVDAIRLLRAEGATLLVTVDCGTTSHEALAEAARIGFDVVVLDHHQAAETLPVAQAVVNPNRLDDLSGQGHLAACGVTFLALAAANRTLRGRGHWSRQRPEPDLIAALDLVALGTVADVVPLKGVNRAFVARGLQVMRRRDRPGLTALMDVARLDGPPRPWHLGFLIGPRINAGGRIGDASLGARLLTTRDETEARSIAATLDRNNRERQTIEAAMVEEAMSEATAALGGSDRDAVIVTASSNWHPGVVGLVASRLKERFRRPAFAIAFSGETGTGSGRSIGGADLGKVVREAVEAGILLKGGGHAMAAGITIEASRVAAFRAFLEDQLGEAVARARATDALAIDGVASAGAADLALYRQLETAGPYGQGNPEPVLAVAGHTVVFADVVGDAHVKLRLKEATGPATMEAIAFRAMDGDLGPALLGARGARIHVAGSLSLDSYGGRERIQMRISDAAAA